MHHRIDSKSITYYPKDLSPYISIRVAYSANRGKIKILHQKLLTKFVSSQAVHHGIDSKSITYYPRDLSPYISIRVA